MSPRRFWLFCLLGLMASLPRMSAAEELKGTQSPLTSEMIKADLGQKREKSFEYGMQGMPAKELDVFWEIYRDYAAEKTRFDDRRLKLLDQYMTNYLTLTNGQVKQLMNDWIELQQDELDLRIKTYKVLVKKTSPLVASRFYQVDDYTYSGLKSQLLSRIPFVGEKLQ